ncbi:Glycine betaine ABC transport system, permease protein OpuAB / Glycine betaine ABC transport system,glycine betaine-binding protein OpuAC [Streptococcus agalactiae]|uniref:Glycine betaine ABC transport system, permease protein OpuAB / Glycine betaine ABC transport system,glycine betaine-binding protein OpuAC n=1 Tax=Streptococcus agalactiae TaxID=1311 RepID=A0AB38VIF0_STRAG|nr:ABC transporter permease/substrate binding protein [Streptococcus agalactiae]SUN09005.1 Glycine betaine ABC transport system, permease protein OpuAB / Glycine betaine ABC transport system,glycine betaine-binding protein OpuAC [Streptococcus agalactiae]VED64387.1 Glycine betaine ABC transport system, permease protein OpuAB / Glycine betaine ABC transport system,glycine betaine-binding protein OpuAC [Streptococcus agalactiae]
MENLLQHKLPVAPFVESTTNWITKTFSGLFDFIQTIGNALMDWMTKTLLFINPLLFIVLITVAVFFLAKKKWQLPTFTFIGLLFIYNQGLWEQLINTFNLVLVASLISIIIGVPLGIWMAKSDKVKQVVNPILDFMQTMPAFVYLIPAVAFFGIGMVPGVFASVVFALPPTVRFTNLAIREIPLELIEASDSFGSTAKQKLFKVELPLAKNTIMAGINQTMMLALSMVVTGSMIGAPGLGREVLSALQHADIGTGFVSGLSLVILAIVLDRVSQFFNSKPGEKQAKTSKVKKWVGLGALALFILAALGRIVVNMTSGNEAKGQKVKIAYVQWDSEVASTNVIAEVLKSKGYDVELTPLDNAVMWQTVANGNADFTTSAWLPKTHGQYFNKYKNSLDDLGPHVENVKIGLVVPKYMNVNSIEELSNQADKQITGIEPGAGIMKSAKQSLKDYPNLSSWKLLSASTGAMTTTLGKAIKNKDQVVITGWSPHWMFAKYDLKYLKDPKKSFGGEEHINTITRKNLKKDMPKVYKIIDKFKWTKEDMESIMLDMDKGMEPAKAAQKWIKNHKKEVSEWTK